MCEKLLSNLESYCAYSYLRLSPEPLLHPLITFFSRSNCTYSYLRLSPEPLLQPLITFYSRSITNLLLFYKYINYIKHIYSV
jgi:hypothetical protein